MRNLIGPAALAAGLMLGSAALAADLQTAGAESATTTSATPVVRQDVVGRTKIDAPITRLTASQPVSYAGLNLANPADVKVMDQRIQSAARQDCAELRDRAPGLMNPVLSGGHCVRSAERDARSSLNAAVLAAKALQ